MTRSLAAPEPPRLSKAVKLLLACLLCLVIIAGGVMLAQRLLGPR